MLEPESSRPRSDLARTERPPLRDRIAVVVNGNAKGVSREVISTLDQILLGGDLFVSRSLEEADDIARTVVSRRYGTVLTGGGDGTFSVMVTKVFREAERAGVDLPRFGFLKLGTGNALSYVVGASGARRSHLAADIGRLREDAGSREISLVEVEGELAPFCGFGADAVALRDYERLGRLTSKTPLSALGRGLTGYALSGLAVTLPGYFRRGPFECRITNRGQRCQRVGPRGPIAGTEVAPGEVLFEGRAHLVAASTIPYYGYGLRAFPFAGEHADCMQLRVSSLSWWPVMTHCRSIWRGEYQNDKRLTDFLVQSVEVEISPRMPLQVGGDVRGERSRAELSLAPRRIRLVDFYAPPSAE